MPKKTETSFEDALKGLKDASADLRSGELDLDKSLERHEDGMRYLKECERQLKDAESRVALFEAELDAIEEL